MTIATILVVDDERSLREMLGMALRDSDYEVQLATNGQQALEIIEQRRPSLVVADVMMPVMDGIALCHHLKEATETATIPIILMSAAGERRAREAGADAFLSKPFDLDDIEALIERLLSPARSNKNGRR